ncbi:6,7-dimethyl-8-ribityllumazine synthase [Asanoa ishikariensis]|uniref:6,7-dimethyl-8-ribityllumazine synthase n=1 Tax=Asanoa ishikariensis TaxID=137265 RepID=A0A1H3SDC5_9ACTN|nr:6,7-dimethyl-8-ribityllumazine synthase [Asanoa ishikariensis]GIF70144.1 6,7-dimethyl-8-ribityllumazine synthase [Asanoa ishikariensis]SDZ36006.1 6,7-dimethyl-8-ribityllumazine synthase [Asanoa ishikariensis]
MAGFGEPDVATVDASGLTVGIVAARWHGELTDHMVGRAVAAAKASAVSDVAVARVAGSVEIPVVAQALAKKYDVVVALGVVIRGSTAHFDYVCQSVTEGLTRVALDSGKPVAHGVLTVNTLEQAQDRAGLPGSAEDKGYAATLAALDAALAIRAI